MKHLFVSMSVKQNLFVSVFVHKCLMMLNDAEHIAFKMFVTQMSNYLFVISFQTSPCKDPPPVAIRAFRNQIETEAVMRLWQRG